MAKDCATCRHGAKTKGPRVIKTAGTTIVQHDENGMTCGRPGGVDGTVRFDENDLDCGCWEPAPETD